jgi:hypothetical protein
MASVEVLENPWRYKLLNHVKNAKREILIVTPFFDKDTIDQILENRRPDVKLRFLLGFSDRSLESAPPGSRYGEAIRTIIGKRPDVEAKQLVGLHAKLYVFDGRTAIVTSANLTKAGLERNIEYGLCVEKEAAQKVHDIVVKCWKHTAAIMLDEEWLRLHNGALAEIERRQRARRGMGEDSQAEAGIGGNRADPLEVRSNLTGVVAILMPANIKDGGRGKIEQILAERTKSGTWVMGSIVKPKTFSPEGAHIYIYATWEKRVRYVATVQRILERGRKMELSDLSPLTPPRRLENFTLLKGGRVRIIRRPVYVFDP